MNKPDSHAPDAPIHYVKDWKNVRLICRPDVPPPPRYRASSNPDIVSCTDCLACIHREIADELEKTFKPKCACGREDCIGDCPQVDFAYDTAREDRFFR